MPVMPTAPPTKPVQDLRLTDLAIIGVPPEFHDQFPSVYAYPAKFSDEAFPVWDALMSDGNFALRARSHGSKDTAWHSTLVEFLRRCEEQGVVPFMESTPTGPTTAFRDRARRGRIFLTEYANEIQLFRKVQVQYAYREYIRTAKGITIYSWARMFPYQDPTFEKWLTSLPAPRFLKHNRSRMVATVRPGVRLWVNCINLYRITVGQEIDVGGATIDIPGNPAPTRQEVDEFIDRTIWMPLVRAIRFDGVENRLF